MYDFKVRNFNTVRTDTFGRYTNDVKKYAIISQEQEINLAERIKKGDKRALAELCQANLRFCISVAKQYQYKGIDLVDLIQYANIGLIKAAKKFDHTRGFKFISYAVWHIRQELNQCLNLDKLIHIPLNKIALYKKVAKISEKQLQREDTLTENEIAEKLKISEKKIKDILLPVSFSINKPLGNEDMTFEDYMVQDCFKENDKEAENNSTSLYLKEVIKKLNPTMQRAINLQYGFEDGYEYSRSETARIMGYSQERIRQLTLQAQKLLKQLIKFRL